MADALYLPQSLHLSSSSDSKFFYNSFNNLFHLMSNRQCSSFVGKSCWRWWLNIIASFWTTTANTFLWNALFDYSICWTRSGSRNWGWSNGFESSIGTTKFILATDYKVKIFLFLCPAINLGEPGIRALFPFSISLKFLVAYSLRDIIVLNSPNPWFTY